MSPDELIQEQNELLGKLQQMCSGHLVEDVLYSLSLVAAAAALVVAQGRGREATFTLVGVTLMCYVDKDTGVESPILLGEPKTFN
jgi:hypothetical protein